MQGSLDQPPILLKAGRKNGAAALVLGLVMTGGGAMMIASSKASGGVFVFALGLVFFFIGLTATLSPAQLAISPGGLELRGALRTRRFPWDEVAAFRPVRLRRAQLIGFDRTGTKARSSLFRDLAMAFTTANVSSAYDAVIPGKWSQASAETVADLLNDARARWGGVQASRALELRPRGSSGQRIDRRLYWLAIFVLLAISAVVSLATHGARVTGGGLSVLWMWVYTRRLHDIGRSGWWQAALFAAQLVLAVVAMLALHLGSGAALGLLLLLQLAFTAVLGAIPGDPETNRFGPPPGAPGLEVQTEVFR